MYGQPDAYNSPNNPHNAYGNAEAEADALLEEFGLDDFDDDLDEEEYGKGRRSIALNTKARKNKLGALDQKYERQFDDDHFNKHKQKWERRAKVMSKIVNRIQNAKWPNKADPDYNPPPTIKALVDWYEGGTSDAESTAELFQKMAAIQGGDIAEAVEEEFEDVERMIGPRGQIKPRYREGQIPGGGLSYRAMEEEFPGPGSAIDQGVAEAFPSAAPTPLSYAPPVQAAYPQAAYPQSYAPMPTPQPYVTGYPTTTPFVVRPRPSWARPMGPGAFARRPGLAAAFARGARSAGGRTRFRGLDDAIEAGVDEAFGKQARITPDAFRPTEQGYLTRNNLFDSSIEDTELLVDEVLDEDEVDGREEGEEFGLLGGLFDRTASKTQRKIERKREQFERIRRAGPSRSDVRKDKANHNVPEREAGIHAWKGRLNKIKGEIKYLEQVAVAEASQIDPRRFEQALVGVELEGAPSSAFAAGMKEGIEDSEAMHGYGYDDAEDEDDDFGAFWHSGQKKAELAQKKIDRLNRQATRANLRADQIRSKAARKAQGGVLSTEAGRAAWDNVAKGGGVWDPSGGLGDDRFNPILHTKLR